MKTKETLTKCPEKNWYFRLSFGHFRLTDTNLAEIRGESTVAHQQSTSTTHPNCTTARCSVVAQFEVVAASLPRHMAASR
jgi:hypothetical protein